MGRALERLGCESMPSFEEKGELRDGKLQKPSGIIGRLISDLLSPSRQPTR